MRQDIITDISNTVIAAVQVCELLPVLAVLAHGPLVSSGHLTLIAGLAGRANFNGGVLKRRGCHRHLVSTLRKSITLRDFCTDACNYPMSSFFTYRRLTGNFLPLFTELISKPNVHLE